MSQSRIRSFFSAVEDDAYAAQLQRDCDEHTATCEQLLYREAALRARHCVEREVGEKRGVGRPRKRPLAIISINNCNNCSVSTGDITVSADLASPVDDLSTVTASAASASASASASAFASASNTATSPTSAVPAKRQRTDWLAKPELAAQIIAAVQLHQSFQAAVTALQRDEKTAGLFDTLNDSTVRHWYNKRSFTLAADGALGVGVVGQAEAQARCCEGQLAQVRAERCPGG